METVAPPKAKRVMTEKQKAGLQKGMDALKLKRESLAKEKDERVKTNVVLKEKGLPPIEPPLKIKGKDIQELPKPEPVELKVPPPRKVRADKGVKRDGTGTALKVTREEFNELKSHLKPSVVEKIVEKEVPVIKEKIVHTEKVLSGSELLNKIFFSK
jgi:hypothetical protein